jgi:hypothetical protein
MIRGCTNEVPVRIIEGIEITHCPLRYLSDVEMDRLQMYKVYKDGFLPNEGGVLNQPIKLLQVIVYIENEMKRLEEAKNA